MKIQRTSYALMAALAGAVALAGCNRDPEPATPMTPPAASTDPSPAMGPAPAMETGPVMTGTTVSSITVGNTAAADRSVAAQSTLGTRDPIIVSVRTEGVATNTTVAARLTFEDGQVAGEESQALNTSGAETTNIEFRNANGWPAGRYTVNVSVDGQPAGMSQQIEIR